MAQIHPSRLNLIPHVPIPKSANSTEMEDAARREEARRIAEKEGTNGSRGYKDGRSWGEREDGREERDRRALPGDRGGFGDRERHGERSHRSERDRDGHREGDRDRDRHAGRERERPRDRDRDGERDRGGDRDDRRRDRDHNQDRDRTRHSSPSYNPYARPPPEVMKDAPFTIDTTPQTIAGYGYGNDRQDLQFRAPPPHMKGGEPQQYISNGARYRPEQGGGGGFGGQGGSNRSGFGAVLSAQEMAARRERRDNSNVNVWPASPKRSMEEEEALEQREKDRKSHKKSSKSKSKSSRHKSSKSKSSKHKSKRRKHKYSSSSDTDSDSESDISDDSEDEKRRKRKRTEVDSLEKEKIADKGKGKVLEAAGDEDEWEVAVPAGPDATLTEEQRKVGMGIEEDDDEVGPQMEVERGAAYKNDPKAFAHMRPGEGAAMAAYAAEGKRIPRRGEIGLSSDQIENFEQMGYVMSGSRHRRMNAVRMRKENQILTQEEKRGILKLQQEEKTKRESMIIGQFKELVSDRLGQSSGGGGGA